jgi:septum site-determining protein MinC
LSTDTLSRPKIRFRGRSFMALVLAPEAPLEGWLAELDTVLTRSPTFFVGRAVVLEASALKGGRAEIMELIAALHDRGIRIIGLEGADPSVHGLGLPPSLLGGRGTSDIEAPQEGAAPAAQPPSSLTIETSVRSGQSVLFPEGDVTILGAVSSGAEVIAGGSVHVYGALRGRVIAGVDGRPGARIFCRKLEAELLAIDGLYQTADDLRADLRGQAVQISLDGDTMTITPLD